MGRPKKEIPIEGKLTIDEIIKNVEKQVPQSKLFTGGDDPYPIQWLPLEIDQLDGILGGGLPFGRMTEIYGSVSVGKTYLAQMAIKSALAKGYSAAFVDVERTFSKPWFEKTGVDTNQLILTQPVGGEEALDIIVSLIENGVDLIVLDSVAALVPTYEAEESVEKSTMGAQARLFNKGLRKITRVNTHSIFLALNQVRSDIGGPFVMDTLPAGRGQDFFSSIQLKVSRGQWMKDNEGIRYGFYMKCETKKNKLHEPMLDCELPFRFDNGTIDVEAGLVELALDTNIIKRSGPQYVFNEQKFFGKLKLLDELRANRELFNLLKEAVKK